MRKRTLIVALIIMNGLFFCENPFFPTTGKPDKSFSARSTPEGLLDQLINAYEQKRLDLYKELLSDSFQFFVAPSFISSNEAMSSYQAKYKFEPQGPDTMLSYTTETKYYYWRKEQEITSHKNLFSDDGGKMKEIGFSPRPFVSKLRYITNSDGDTVNAEMLITDGELQIKISTKEFFIPMVKQVFLLERDKKSNELWVIRKWYDLSNVTSDI